jgi:Uri superfamily endonuclease
MDKGIYCLIFRNLSSSIRVGALGTVSFPGGWHVYTGSAQGPGGMSRVRRHIKYAEQDRKKPRWHVDYLLGSTHFKLVYAVCGFTADKMECSLSNLILNSAIIQITRFGCSDCSCRSHLGYFSGNPLKEVVSTFETLGIPARIKTINTINA